MELKILFTFIVLSGCLLHICLEAYYFRNVSFSINKKIQFSYFSGPLEPNSLLVIQNLRTNYLRPPSQEDYNLTSMWNPIYAQNYHQFFWSFVDYYLKEFFGNTYYGFFFEAGALDGEFLSHTLWLEQRRNWTGILVEPDELSYKYLLSKHRKAWASNTCISKVEYPEEIVLETFSASKESKEGFWIIKAQTRNVAEREYFEIDKEFEVRSSPSYTKCQCFPLLSYFLALNISVVDFLSLDTQGGEFYAIKNFLKCKFAPFVRTISVEHIINKILGTIDKSLVNLMDHHNFTFVDIDPASTYFFFNRNDKELSEIFNSKKLSFIPVNTLK